MNLFNFSLPEKFYIRVQPNVAQEKVRLMLPTGTQKGVMWPGYDQPMVLKLWVNAPARDGKGNAAVVSLLSKHFQHPKTSFSILRGHSSRDKVIGYTGN